MADQALNEKWQRLMAIAERLTNQGPPVVNVNISLGDLLSKKKSKSSALSSPETQTPDTPEPAGYPRPYTS